MTINRHLNKFTTNSVIIMLIHVFCGYIKHNSIIKCVNKRIKGVLFRNGPLRGVGGRSLYPGVQVSTIQYDKEKRTDARDEDSDNKIYSS